MKKLTLLMLTLLLIKGSLMATHINGGSIVYTKLAGNNYEIKLTVYRDCFNGVPPFDNPAGIGFFDAVTNALVTEVLLSTADSNLISVESDCVPNNVCLVRAIYTFNITLPLNVNGYIVTYQRCCRSSIIQNIVSPDQFGITLFAKIPGSGMINSSPVFNHEVPSLGYVGFPFQFDASAVDSDGDSLSYGLDSLYDGATTANPVPQPPFNPPYNTLTFQSPYSINDMIGGNPPLTFDDVTGLMTVTPGTAGVFQIAQKVNEYRNGILINTSRREFMFYVAPANVLNLSGNATVELATQNLDIGNAWLVNLNLYDSTLTAVDTNSISNGLYSFTNALNGVYLVKASADSTSAFYQNHIPTYYGDELYWYNASHVDLCLNDTSDININLIKGQNPGGPGFVGGLISQGANRVLTTASLQGITIILVDALNQPVAYAVTNSLGEFSVSNIPYGIYKVYTDRLNYYVDNALAPTINITNTTTQQFQFILHDTWLEWIGFTSLPPPGNLIEQIEIVPNPNHGSFQLVKPQLQSHLSLFVYNIVGEMVFQKELAGSGSETVSLPQLNNGIYQCLIYSNEKLVVKKLVITK